ncbi:MAG: hypothetical protein M9900_13615 [Flavobacteriales bacterium]|nr:hypothetical protein [Flavobacteriales bacterium]
MAARFLLLMTGWALATCATAQVPIIDYGFLAVPPSVEVNSIVVQPDGKILVGGAFTNYAGSGKNNLVRLNNDGTVDPGWNPGGAGPGHVVQDIVLMSDGRILIGGAFTAYNGQVVQFVARLLPDGTRDTTFNIPDNTINGAVRAIALQKDNKVIAVGDFFECWGHSSPHIARFNPDGSPDLDFDMGTGFNENVHDVLVLPDLRIAVTGAFTLYDGHNCGHVAVLTEDGPYDTSVQNDPGFSGTGSVGEALALQPDGKLLVAGELVYHNGTAAGGVLRLNPDGTRDNGFNAPFYPFATVNAVAVQDNGRILVGGEYTDAMYAAGITGPNRITRLLADGSVDTSFAVGAGALPEAGSTAYIRSIAVQPDGRILAGGRFGALDTETQYRQLIRLYPEAPTGVGEPAGQSSLQVFQDPSTRELVLHGIPRNGGASEVLIHDGSGRLVFQATPRTTGQQELRLAPHLDPGVHVVSFRQGGFQASARLLVR